MSRTVRVVNGGNKPSPILLIHERLIACYNNNTLCRLPRQSSPVTPKIMKFYTGCYSFQYPTMPSLDTQGELDTDIDVASHLDDL